MNRTLVKWSVFVAALALVLTVMIYFTWNMLHFEKAAVESEARATTEGYIRLALWRMDSTAALSHERAKSPPAQIYGNGSNFNGEFAVQNSAQQRFNPQVQQQLSMNEYQQRAAVNRVATDDWRKIEPMLLDRVSDILPGATLEAVDNAKAQPDDTRRLTSIPARLVVPASAFVPPTLPWNTPLRISLMIAWTGALIAAAAVAMLLAGALSLSERRGAFVSAVTHELRTPLTTFRMYSEMLASGMVSDPSARQQYLDTLVSESDRLGHLIENVLAYARLERQLSPSRAQTVTLAELLERALPTLRRRAEQAGVALNVSQPDSPEKINCKTDTIAVQQILLNLVDNACKYGRSDIALKVTAADSHLEFRVTDNGPGIDSKAAGRLFLAFSKAKNDAVPGIGLGLFLSRRLARALGGDLRHIASNAGATFVLELPRA